MSVRKNVVKNFFSLCVFVMILLVSAKAISYHDFNFVYRKDTTYSTAERKKEDNKTGYFEIRNSDFKWRGSANFRIRTANGSYATNYVLMSGNGYRHLTYFPNEGIQGRYYKLFSNPERFNKDMWAKGLWAP